MRSTTGMNSNFRGPIFRAIDTFTAAELDVALRRSLQRMVEAARCHDAGVGQNELEAAAADFMEGLDATSLGFLSATVPCVADGELAELGGLVVELGKMRAALGGGSRQLGRLVTRCPHCAHWWRGNAAELPVKNIGAVEQDAEVDS